MLIVNKLLIPAYKAMGSVGGTDTVINSKNATIKNSVFIWFFYNVGKRKIIASKGKKARIIKYFAESSKKLNLSRF